MFYSNYCNTLSLSLSLPPSLPLSLPPSLNLQQMLKFRIHRRDLQLEHIAMADLHFSEERARIMESAARQRLRSRSTFSVQSDMSDVWCKYHYYYCCCLLLLILLLLVYYYCYYYYILLLLSIIIFIIIIIIIIIVVVVCGIIYGNYIYG